MRPFLAIPPYCPGGWLRTPSSGNMHWLTTMVSCLFFNACGRGSSPQGSATPQIQTKTVQIAPSFDTQALFILMLTHGASHAHSIWCSLLDTHALELSSFSCSLMAREVPEKPLKPGTLRTVFFRGKHEFINKFPCEGKHI